MSDKQASMQANIQANIQAIVTHLDALIRLEVPDAVPVAKYGGTLYTRHPDKKEGQFCGVFPYEKHAQLSFSKGAALDDPGGVLDGSGKHRRHINFADVTHVDDDDLRVLIRQSSEL